MKAVIMAGGKGTRIASLHPEMPKPMIPVLGKPILQYEIECLSHQGIKEFILVIGHLGQKIRDYFKEGSSLNVSIEYLIEEEPLGTAGALFWLKEKVIDDFLLINGDLIFEMDLHRLVKFHKDRNASATIVTHPNAHPYDSGIIETEKNGKVLRWIHREETRDWYQNRVNAGIHLLSPEIFTCFPILQKRDLDRDIFPALIKAGQLYAYDTPEYIKDMGTPERFEEVVHDVESGLVMEKSLSRQQRAVFLDRDGTINRQVGFLTDIHTFELLEGVAEAIRLIHQCGYLVIVVTNQPVIARGEITIPELEEIHKKMETLLGEQGAYVDALYYCPHHPDKGFAGEREEYKIPCKCRKPSPGMLQKAAKDWNIDLTKSFMIGDSEQDKEAGEAAGCRSLLLGEASLLEVVKQLRETMI